MTDIFKDATPRPWSAADKGDYEDFDGTGIVILGDDRRIAVVQGVEANAALIVTAVNAYEPMLEALLDAFAILDNVEEINPSNYDHNLVCALNASAFDAWEVIKTAIHKLRKDGLTQLEEVQE